MGEARQGTSYDTLREHPMSAPPNVRIEERFHEPGGPAYRRTAEGAARVITVRGSSPLRARATLWALALGAAVAAGIGAAGHRAADIVALALGVATAQVGVMVLWRSVRTVRLELSRGRVMATSRPLGPTSRVEAWAARRPIVVSRTLRWARPLVTFSEWDLFLENDDGRRVLVATLLDETSASFVARTLAESYRDATDAPARDPFAMRFGPLPERVSCDGDLDDPRGAWRIEVRCPRQGLAHAALGAAIVWPAMLGSFALVGAIVLERRELFAATCPFLVWLALAVWSVRLAHEVAMRASGRVVLGLTRDALAVRARPPLSLFTPRGTRHTEVLGVTVRRQRRDAERATLWLRGPRGHRDLLPGFPIDAEDAAYVARVLEAYYVSPGHP